MKEKIEQLDKMLNEISVKGDDVLRMCNARRTLQEIYAEATAPAQSAKESGE